jgi:hypothetical protein
MWRWATYYARPATDQEATAQARERLSLMLDGLAALGVPVEGDLGSPTHWMPSRRCARAPVRPDHRDHPVSARLPLAQGRPAPSGGAPVRIAGHDHHHQLLCARFCGHSVVTDCRMWSRAAPARRDRRHDAGQPGQHSHGEQLRDGEHQVGDAPGMQCGDETPSRTASRAPGLRWRRAGK